MNKNVLLEAFAKALDQMEASGGLDGMTVDGYSEPQNSDMITWENNNLAIEDEGRGPIYTGHGEVFSAPGQLGQPQLQVGTQQGLNAFGMPQDEDTMLTELGLA